MLLPGGLLMGLAGPTVGRIIDRYGPRVLTIPGAALLTFTLWQFSNLNATTPIWVLVGLHMVLMLGLACLFTPCFTAGLNPLPPYLYSHGSAILATLQQVAGAAGVALLVAIMAGKTATLSGAGPAAAGCAERRYSDRLQRRRNDQHRDAGIGLLHSEHQAADGRRVEGVWLSRRRAAELSEEPAATRA